MTRIFLTYILPLALPTLLYVGWLMYHGKRAKAKGDAPPQIASTGIFVSIIIGFFLMMAGLIYVAMTSGVAPDAGKYQSPRYEDGKIIPPSYTK